MRMPLVHGYELMIGNKMHVTFWQQPLHRWLMYEIYHWYDMRVFRLPGFKALERWLQRRSHDPMYVPLAARQDLRCYHLAKRGRVTLADIEIDHETYAKLRRRYRRDD